MVQTEVRKNEQPSWNKVYSEALVAARAECPNDSLAQHRIAERAADRAMHTIKAAKASSRDSQKLLVDQAFLEVFGSETAGGRGPFLAVEFFPDRVLARGADGRLYDISYAVGVNGVTFGGPELASSIRYIAASSADATTLAEIKATEAVENLRTALETAQRLASIEARASEALCDASRRCDVQLEESSQMLSLLAAYAQALVESAGEEAGIIAIESAQYRGILAGCEDGGRLLA